MTTTEKEDEIFEYLRDLRDGGSINMMGASPYIEEAFGLTRPEAKDIFIKWMKNPNGEAA